MKKMVLVVDDEYELREILREEFEYCGYAVLEAENGTQALEVLKTNSIDVVVSDIRMPGGNGLDLLQCLSHLSGYKPPVILVSAYAGITIKEAEDQGAFAFVSKPYDINVLMQQISKAVEMRAS